MIKNESRVSSTVNDGRGCIVLGRVPCIGGRWRHRYKDSEFDSLRRAFHMDLQEVASLRVKPSAGRPHLVTRFTFNVYLGGWVYLDERHCW